MTPLDCALQRGFRSTAKFLQLHGGIPASKLANVRRIENETSSANLNIRDDVTLWGDSSDDERENNELPDVDRKKRSSKKKFKKDDGGKQIRSIKMKRTTSDELLHYSSEVIVSDERNGTINIEQNGEIILSDKQREKQTFVKSIIPVVTTDTKIERRPKSAKGTKVTTRKKTVSNSQNMATEGVKELPKKTVANESTETEMSVKTVVENVAPKTQETVEETTSKVDSLEAQKTENQVKNDADKQSLVSSTSAEEGDKEVVVEAHVHSPPKNTSVEEVKENFDETLNNGKAAKENEVLKEDKVVDGAESKVTSVDQQIKKEIEEPTKAESTSVEDDAAQTNSSVVPAVEETVKEEAKSINGSNSKEEKTKRLIKQDTILVAHNETSEKIAEINEVKDIVEKTIIAAKEEVQQDVKSEEVLESAKEEEVQEVSRIAKEIVTTADTVKKEVSTTAEEVVATIDAVKEEAKETVFSSVVASGEEVEKEAKPEILAITEDTKQEIVAVVKQREEDTIISPEVTTKVVVEAITIPEKTIEETSSKNEIQIQKSKTSSSEKEITKSGEAHVATKEQKRKTRATVDETTKFSKTRPTKTTIVNQPKKKQFLKPTLTKRDGQYDASAEMKSSEEESTSPSSSSKDNRKEHKSFRVLDDSEEPTVRKIRSKSQVRKTKTKIPLKKERSKSEETKSDHTKDTKRSKIPTPIRDLKPRLSKSDKHLDRVPFLSDLRQDSKNLRSESSMTAPIHASTFSDNDRDSISDMEEMVSSATRRKRLKKRIKTRESKSAGSDYESSNLIDSGFEPSPRSSRLPKWKNMSERGVDMTSVTQTIQTNIRR